MTSRYAQYGVNVSEADKGILRLVARIKSTWPGSGDGKVMLDIGYFANVIDIGHGIGLAMTTDGVGSKTRICEIMNRFDTIGIDVVAMNVNDLICIGAKPLSMTDYIGVTKADADMIDQIGIGLAEGARQAGISISGGEVSQLGDILNGFDLVGHAMGIVPLDRIITGSEIASGDVVIGIASNGIHANGLTFARRVLFDETQLDPGDPNVFPSLGRSLGDELLRPTAIYVKEILEIIDKIPVKALVNITGDGLFNLLRVDRDDAGFVLDALPEPPPIFTAIAETSAIDAANMYETYNMGVGFCIVVAPQHAATVNVILARYNRQSSVIGHIEPDAENTLYLPAQGLVGKGKKFYT